MKRKLATFLGLLLLALAVQGRIAGADGPLIQLIPFSTTRTFTNCGFEVVQHIEGTVRVIASLDESGSPVSVTLFDRSVITLTNPLNGKTLSSRRNFFDREVYYDDGSIIYGSAGLVSHLILPGEGLVAANVGALRFLIDSEGNVTDLVVAGEHDGPLRDLVCEYLQ